MYLFIINKHQMSYQWAFLFQTTLIESCLEWTLRATRPVTLRMRKTIHQTRKKNLMNTSTLHSLMYKLDSLEFILSNISLFFNTVIRVNDKMFNWLKYVNMNQICLLLLSNRATGVARVWSQHKGLYQTQRQSSCSCCTSNKLKHWSCSQTAKRTAKYDHPQ